ncbi:hypothetical protein [Streptomyces avermitilis]|uniref:hypothetical protein n=1 Tax=Streptomyces avermitilis TaxID=33903 RepID=UPI0033B81A90
MTEVLGVHGVWNFRSGESPELAAKNLAGIWQTGISRGLARAAADPGNLSTQRASGRTELPVTVAYYADLLRKPGRQSAGSSLDDLDDFEAQIARDWFEALGLPDGVAAGRATMPLRQAAAWLAGTRFLGKAATEWFVAGLFREVAAYLRDPAGPARIAARERVIEALVTSRARVVVAHSLGSVVAYEALWQRTDLEVDLLITLGSPLALPHAVFPRLEPTPTHGSGARPPGVRRWVNLAYSGDIVAIPAGGVSRFFEGVDIDDHATIHAFDFHLVKNYLAHERVGRHLLGLR